MITFVLGLLIVTLKFWGLLWVLGTLVGISFLFSGLELIIFSSTLHDDQILRLWPNGSMLRESQRSVWLSRLVTSLTQTQEIRRGAAV